jgi:predicted lipoprotein with Yx(FWY)xxD motif
MRMGSRSLAMVALVMLLVACGGQDVGQQPGEPDATTPPGTPAAPDGEPTEDTPTNGDVTVSTASTDLGTVLVDADGMTLYLFDPDAQGASSCYDDCAANWPPLTADDPTAGAGVDSALLGTTERDDGTVQVTYDGWPLYRWAGDEQPGDTTGQGIQDVWWVIAPDATPVRDAEEPDSRDY